MSEFFPSADLANSDQKKMTETTLSTRSQRLMAEAENEHRI